MDLQGLPKKSYRHRYMSAYEMRSGRAFVPRNEFVFTLGGISYRDGKIIKDCELDYLTTHNVRTGTPNFIKPHQFVSVEWDKKIHQQNKLLPNATWLYGDFVKCLGEWGSEEGNASNLAIVAADFMGGWERHKGDVCDLFEYLSSVSAPLLSKGTLLVINILQFNQQRYAWSGNGGCDVEKAFRADKEIRIYMRDNVNHEAVELLDVFTYPNKTIGCGARNSIMTSLILWIPKRRRFTKNKEPHCGEARHRDLHKRGYRITDFKAGYKIYTHQNQCCVSCEIRPRVAIVIDNYPDAIKEDWLCLECLKVKLNLIVNR